MCGYDDYLLKIKAKKEKIKKTDLSRLLKDKTIEQFENYNKVEFVSFFCDEWNYFQITYAIEKTNDSILLTYKNTKEYGEKGHKDKSESWQKVIENNTENLNLFHLLCKEIYDISHYIYKDETGYDFKPIAKLFKNDCEIRTGFVSPVMVAIILHWTDIEDIFISGTEENYLSYPMRDKPNIITNKPAKNKNESKRKLTF